MEIIDNEIIVFDTETTGLSYKDQILSLSIVNGCGDVLFDELIRPKWKKRWPEAQRIHHISPEMVKDKQTITPHKKKIQEIFDHAKVIVGYNVNYDLGFIKKAGIVLKDQEIIDVMEDFAEIYGEWNDYYETYKWQKLSTCADYYGYKWDGDAHSSLADTKATLYCFKKIHEK